MPARSIFFRILEYDRILLTRGGDCRGLRDAGTHLGHNPLSGSTAAATTLQEVVAKLMPATSTDSELSIVC